MVFVKLGFGVRQRRRACLPRTCGKWKRTTCRKFTKLGPSSGFLDLGSRGSVKVSLWLGLLPPFDHGARVIVMVRVGPNLCICFLRQIEEGNLLEAEYGWSGWRLCSCTRGR